MNHFEVIAISAIVLTMRLEDLGLIGNCQFSALVERSGAVVWCCLPRFDSEPVFSTPAGRPGRRRLPGRSGRRRTRRPALPRELQRPRDDVRDPRRHVARPRLRASVHPVRPPVQADPARPHRRARERHAAHPRALQPAARLVQAAGTPDEGLQSRALRGLPGTAPPDDGHPGLVPLRAAVRPHRPPTPRPLVGRTRRGAAARPVLALPAGDVALLAAMGQGVRRPAAASSRR